MCNDYNFKLLLFYVVLITICNMFKYSLSGALFLICNCIININLILLITYYIKILTFPSNWAKQSIFWEQKKMISSLLILKAFYFSSYHRFISIKI